jgi:thiol-disulfide isomerase/thioredoxin
MKATVRPARGALAWLLAASLLGAAGASAQPEPRRRPEVQIGQTLQDASLRGLNGPTRKLSDFRGKPLLINVWASWCGPCRDEMASLERLAWKELPLPLVIVGISTDDYPERALALLKHTNATISHYIDRQLELESLLGASRLPLTVLVNAQGQVVQKVYGARQWDSAESQALIQAAFKARPAALRP